MRIGFDAKRAFFNATGLGNYSRNLLLALAETFPGHEYLLFTPPLKKQQSLFPQGAVRPFKTVFPTSLIGKAFPSLWRSIGMGNSLVQEGVQVFHGMSNELPSGLRKRNIPSVVTIHDLIFIRFPSQYKPVDRKIYERKFNAACHSADLIVAASQQTSEDIQEYFGLNAEKIKVVYQSAHRRFYESVSQEPVARMRSKGLLPEGEFMLSVGSFTERKNQIVLLKAMQAAGDKLKWPLVLVGNGKEYLSDLKAFIDRAGLKSRVYFIHDIADEHLPALYAAASVFIYPSLFEGFGIPVLESLCTGTPVVTSTGSCFAEVGGEAALYCDPLNPESWKETLIRLQENESLRLELSAAGKARSLQFSPAVHAREMMKVYSGLSRHS